MAWLNESRSLVIRCLTSLNSKIQTGAPECVSFHLNKPMLYKSHEVANLKFNQILWNVDGHFPEPDVVTTVSADADPHADSDSDPAVSQGGEPAPSSLRHDADQPKQPRSTLWVDDDGAIIALNPLDDYMYRPRSIVLPLYLFVEKYEKKAAAFKDGKDKGTRRFPKKALQFSKQHPQHKTHYLQLNKHSKVPWIQGPTLARNPKEEPERFGKLATCLFKTWWTWEELRNSTDSWEQTWAQERVLLDAFDPTTASAAEKYTHSVTIRVLRNSVAIHVGVETVSEERKALDIHRKVFKAQRVSGCPPDDNPLQEAFIQHLHERPLTLPDLKHSEVRSHKWASDAVDIIERHCPLRPTVHTPGSKKSAWIRNWTAPGWNASQHRAVSRKVSAMNKQSFETMLTGQPAADVEAKTKDSEPPTHPGKHRAPTVLPPDAILPTLREIAEEFTLNANQRYAFLVIGTTFLDEYNGLVVPEDRREQVAQLLMYVGGSGGVGKSRVISAVVHMFEAYGKRHWLRIGAYTAFAAGQVGGTTTHALMAEQKGGDKRKCDETYNPSARKIETLHNIWTDARFFILDECSMLSCNWNGMLAARMETGRHSQKDQPYGGVHVIFFGDFAQLPPISTTGRPLYTRAEWLNAKKSKRATIGRTLWENLTHAIILDQGMRAAGDPEFQSFLERLRHGTSHLNPSRGGTYEGPQDDYDYIHTRLIDNIDITPKLRDDLQRNGGIVTRNVVRMVTNNDSALKEARLRGVRPLVSVALDSTGVPNDRLSFKTRRTLLGQYESAANGYYAGCLVLTPGMRYALKSHVARDLCGLSRNSVGILLKVVLDPREPADLTPHSLTPRFLQYVPKQALMYFPDAPDIRFHVNLPNKTVSIKPRSATMEGKTPSGNPIRRWQFPFVLAAFGTDYNNQGRTFVGAGYVDLARPTDPRGYNAATPYVCLSRFTTLDDIVLLRPIPLAQFKRVITSDQLDDAKRLQTLSNKTIASYEALYQDTFPGFDPDAVIPRTALRPKKKPTLQELFDQVRSCSDDMPTEEYDSADHASDSDEEFLDEEEKEADNQSRELADKPRSKPMAPRPPRTKSTVHKTGNFSSKAKPPRRPRKKRPATKKKATAPKKSSAVLPPWQHITPPPGPWTHNNCGPYAVLEVCLTMMRCVPVLRNILPAATVQVLDTIAVHRQQSPAVTRRTPWTHDDTCLCGVCRNDNRTAQDAFIEKEVYAHINSNRTADDNDIEGMQAYVVDRFCDMRRLLENTLGIRDDHQSPLPGFGLSVIHQCWLCKQHTTSSVLAVEPENEQGKPLPGTWTTTADGVLAPGRHDGTPQRLLDQLIGVESILDHLPHEPDQQLKTVTTYGGRCSNQACFNANGDRWANSVLPLKLDPDEPLPPVLRINKRLGSDTIDTVCDTVCVPDPSGGPAVTYDLLAVIYAIKSHFTTDIRYKLDSGDRQFWHYDPFNFRQDRVLALAGNLPACQGGLPEFLPRHTLRQRTKFHEFTLLTNVTSFVYIQQDPSHTQTPAPAEAAASPQPASSSSSSSSAPSQQLKAITRKLTDAPDFVNQPASPSQADVQDCHPSRLCRCGLDLSNAEDGSHMICCDFCDIWVHSECVSIDPSQVPDSYVCFHCDPA